MEVTAKQKLLLKKLKQQIKKLRNKEEQSRAKMRSALKEVNKIGHTYKVRLARKMREMERKIAHSEVACYAKLALDLENQLVKGIKQRVKVLTAAAKRAKRPAAKQSPHKRTPKRSTARRRGQKKPK